MRIYYCETSSKVIMEDLFDFDAKFDKNLTKIWATKLVAELSTSFEKLALRLDKMYETFNKRFDDLEMKLRGDITQITKTAESAMELATENKSEVELVEIGNGNSKTMV